MIEIESKHIRCSSFTELGFKVGDTFVLNQEELFLIDDSVGRLIPKSDIDALAAGINYF